MIDIQAIKQRYGIIGNSPQIDRAITIAVQVAETDLTVLITGESGVGKENFPKIIHQNSARKHGQYVAVNCGAIPEGTIDSELFGHEKGSFTGATDARKGYFEQASGGTIFLDEVAELPLSTQVRLLRVLESGEYLRVGSSKVQKTDVRVVAATNMNVLEAISRGKFREDLYYRLNTIPIHIPPLRERKTDMLLLFKRFSIDFSQKYKMPPIELDDEAESVLLKYCFPGNVRQLKNMVEQIAIIESDRLITADLLRKYIPQEPSYSTLPVLKSAQIGTNNDMVFERELVFKFLAEMQKDIADLKDRLSKLTASGGVRTEKSLLLDTDERTNLLVSNHYNDSNIELAEYVDENLEEIADTEDAIPLSLLKNEREIIQKALEKNKGRRKQTAAELEISERTLYRRLREMGMEG
jgi:transcriptional regulator with PAS, ATPase and Fis domain